MQTQTNETILSLDNGRQATIKGVSSIKGTHYFQIKYKGKAGHVPQGHFVTDKNEARKLLHQQGVTITSDRDWRAIIEGIESIHTFKKAPLIETPGWTAPYFAQANGRVFSPKGQRKGRPIYPPNKELGAIKGSLPDWLANIAEPIAGQWMPMVAIMAAFAAPLLELSGETHNLGFEFCGPPAKGKTTCLMLMASVAGNPSRIPTFNTTNAGLEGMFAGYKDMPFPVDEANLADSGATKFLKDFAFRMANGTVKVTAYQPDRAQHRFVFATTANRPFHESLRGYDADTAGAALQRLLSLKVDGEHEHGAFHPLPETFSTSGALASHLADAMKDHYGIPMKAFLTALVQERGRNLDGFKAGLVRHMKGFEKAVGVAGTAQGKSRASSAFGLLYAAGSFAKMHGILPEAWNCKAACEEAYRNYQALLPDHTPLPARLATIARLPGTHDLRKGRLPRLKDRQMASPQAFIKTGRGKRIELLCNDAMRDRFFPDWTALQASAEFKSYNLRDSDHATKQRGVRWGVKKERFYCFILPVDIVSLLPSSS